jgi:outer membrane protein assembly factor BamB
MRRNEPAVPVSEGEAVMRVFLFGFAVALACCCSAQEATAQSHPLAPLLPTNTSLGRVGLTRMWWGSATMDSKRDKLLYLALDDTHLFAHCSNGIICCFDAETGRKLWATALGGQDEPAYAPTSNHKYVIILSGSILFALKKETGDIAWQFPLEDGPTTPPVVDEDQVYFGTADGSMMAYNLEKLSDNFMKRRKAESAYRAFVFKYTIRTHILEAPVVLDKNVAFAGSGTHVTTYVLGQNRQLKYEFDTPEPLSCGLAAHNNMLVICSEDSQIYALNMITGGLRWQAVMGGPVTQTPRVVENDLYVSPSGVGLRRFDLRTGTEKWANPVAGVSGFVSVSRPHGAKAGSVYATDKAGNLVKINRETGVVTSRIVLDRFTIRVPNELTDRLYIASPTGTIIAMREKERELPVYFKYPDRLPIMPEFAPETSASEKKPAEGDAPAKEEPAAATEKPAEAN